MPLAEPFLVFAQDQRHVGEHRRLRAQGLIELHLPRRVGQVVVAPDDVGDAHVDVVAYHAEVVRGAAVRPGEDQVVQFRVIELDPALDLVVHHRGAALRRPEPDGERNALRQRHRCPLRRPAGAVIHRLALCLHRRLPLGVQGLRRAYAGIGIPRAQERTEPLLVERHPFGLVERPLVPVELQPLHAPEDGVDGFRRRPLAVRVLDPQDELAAAVPRVQVVEQRRTGAADMQVARRAGGETCSDFGHGSRWFGGRPAPRGAQAVRFEACPACESPCYWRTPVLSNHTGQRSRPMRDVYSREPKFDPVRPVCHSSGSLPASERWPSGRRRTPAKRVYLKRVPRVRIPLSPPPFLQ